MIGSILISVLIVSFIGAALAAMLVVSEHFIANYGECKININDERDLTVQGGKNLLSMLTAEKIFIPSACGGRGTCGLCKVKVLEGAGAILPTEEPYLSKEERTIEHAALLPGQGQEQPADPDPAGVVLDPRVCDPLHEDRGPHARHQAVPPATDRAGDDRLRPRPVCAGAHAGL